MLDLKDALDDLHKLDDIRDRAKELREQGLRSLRKFRGLEGGRLGTNVTKEEGDLKKYFHSEDSPEIVDKWSCSSNKVEVSLLVKAQNHRNLSESDDDNDNAEASEDLTEELEIIDLEDLLPHRGNQPLPHQCSCLGRT